MTLTVGSLFSGIGGLDLGLERAGMRVIWQSEIDPYACEVLKKHWPEVPNYGDIKEIKWEEVARPNVICGGYPCQPFSQAGKRRGEEDPRHLWPWVREAIGELRPRYAIMENVRGHLSMGGLSVIGELAAIGYDAEWRVVSAASVGANHRRDRIIIVAYPNSEGWQRSGWIQQASKELRRLDLQSADRRWTPDMAYPDLREVSWRLGSISENSGLVFGGDNIGRGTQGYAGWQWWESEPNMGRVAHGVPSRVDRLKGLGNAVVPQVAEVIGRLIMEADA